MNGEGERWTLYNASQFLPAVLTDPNKGKQSNFFTKTWGDSFVEHAEIQKSPFLPEITYAHFEQYLRKYGKRYRRHVRTSQSKFENNTLKSKSESSSSNLTEVVPEMYLKQEFNLNDNKVFSAVFNYDHKSEHELQDELSLYLDVVEEKIAKQVAQKSGAFFHAMTSHDTIMEQMGVACHAVQSLRTKMKQIDESLACKSLKLLALARGQSNRKQFVDKMKLMSTVLQTQPNLQLLLSSSDYVGALELIASTQEVLAKELAGVTSLRYLPSQLKEMLGLIDKMLSAEFERYAAADLHRPFENNEGVLEHERFVSIVAGLLRRNHLQFLETYKKEAITAAQILWKQLQIEQMAHVQDEINEVTETTEVTSSLDAAHWLKVLSATSNDLAKLIQRVKNVHDVIKETSDNSVVSNHNNNNLNGSERFLTEEQYINVVTKLKDLLISICDHCNERLASLISTHSDKQSITIEQVKELAIIVDNFLKKCESVCGKQGAALKAAFKIQAGNYVQKFHSQRKHKLMLLLDAETWRSAEVPTEIQMLIDKLALGEVIDRLPQSPTEEQMSTGQYFNRPAIALTVASQQYVTVGTALILVRLVTEYCVCAHDLPISASTIGRNLAELLKTFNTRCCQLVLGAGAVVSAGLQRITSTNLALTSRSLQLLLWIIPSVRNHFHALTVDNLSVFDNVEKDIQHHIQQLEAKILSILNSLISDQVSEWDAKPPVPSRQFRNVSKHLTKLHEAVSAVLPDEQISDIYQAIHENFKSRIRDKLAMMNIQNNGGPQHGVVTSEMLFYLQTINMLKVLPDKYLTDDALDDIWSR